MSNTPRKAIVLAAGLGKRMRPLTDTMPKPLIPVKEKALLDYVLDFVADAGVREAVVNTSYKAEMIKAHVAKRTMPKLQLTYEETPLETGGGIANALHLLGDAPFFSLNSDSLIINKTTPALQALSTAWDDATMDALLLLHPTDKAIGFDGRGDFFLQVDGSLKRADGKPAPYVFTGLQIIHPRLFAGCPSGAFSLNTLYDRDLNRIRAMVHDGDWLHVGDPQGLKLAEDYFK